MSFHYSLNFQGWDNLPPDVLIHLFSYLNPNQRFVASLVCKSWSQIFRSPKLWKSVVCVFSSKKRIRRYSHCTNENALVTVARTGPFIKSLSVRWNPVDDGWILSLLIALFQWLLHLKTVYPEFKIKHFQLRMCDYSSSLDVPINDELIFSVARFLRAQDSLESFEINWRMTELKSAILLDGVSTHCGDCMKLMNIEDIATHRRYRIPPLLQKYLLSFKYLWQLKLAYEDIEETALQSLIAQCNTLRRLDIKVSEQFLLFLIKPIHKVSSQTWISIKQLAPSLGVHFVLDPFAWTEELIKDIFAIEIPLVGLTWRLQAYQAVLLLCIIPVSASLEFLNLHFDVGEDGSRIIIDSVHTIVKLSPSLKRLEVKGNLSLLLTIDMTLQEILRKYAKKTALSKIIIISYGLNAAESRYFHLFKKILLGEVSEEIAVEFLKKLNLPTLTLVRLQQFKNLRSNALKK